MSIDNLGNILGVVPLKKERETGQLPKRKQKDKKNEDQREEKEEQNEKEGRIDIRV